MMKTEEYIANHKNYYSMNEIGTAFLLNLRLNSKNCQF